MNPDTNLTNCLPTVRPILAQQKASHRERTWSAACQDVLFYFMDRFTCSHCWQVAVQLARQQALLEERGIKVVLVGGHRYGHEAARLAKDLGLSFPIIADRCATLKQRYLGKHQQDSHGSLVLVDSFGRSLQRQTIPSPAQYLDLGQFLAVGDATPS